MKKNAKMRFLASFLCASMLFSTIVNDCSTVLATELGSTSGESVENLSDDLSEPSKELTEASIDGSADATSEEDTLVEEETIADEDEATTDDGEQQPEDTDDELTELADVDEPDEEDDTEEDEAVDNSTKLIASFDFDDEETGLSGAGAVAGNSGVTLTSEESVSGASAYFNGSSYLSVTAEDGSSLLTGYDALTVSYARKYLGGNGWTFYAAPSSKSLTWNTDGNKEYYIGFTDTSSTLTVERFMNGRGNGSLKTQDTTSDWEYVTVVLDESKSYIYINGELKSTSSGSEYSISNTLGDSSILQIGKANWGSGEYFKGYIDNYDIYSGALSADEVKSLYYSKNQDLLKEELKTEILNGNESFDKVVTALSLPSTFAGYSLKYSFDTEDVIGKDGSILYEGDATAQVKITVNATSNVGSFTEEYSAIVRNPLYADYSALVIYNANDIRGNITLPLEGEYGSKISWKSSNTKVITDEPVENEGYDATPAGVVTRGKKDQEVQLTATLTYVNGETTLSKEKTFTLTVKAAVEQEKTTDYLFAYFTGNTISGENIYFATSEDGLNYDELNDSQYILTSELGEMGLRDPFIMRSHEGDKFYIIATDLSIGRDGDWTRAQKSGSQAIMVWESTDLVNWSSQRMAIITDTIDAGCTWAPEAYYDEITGEYVVFWASKVADDNYSLQRIYYSKTRDFRTFTEPQVWIDRKTCSTIDTTIVAGNDGYLYRISKNEGGGTATWSDGSTSSTTASTVYVERSKTMFGNWERVTCSNLTSITGVEGPTAFKFNDDDVTEDTWAILLDHFGGNGYAPVVTTDLNGNSFTTPASYSLPSAPRHGTVMNITASEYANLLAAYGTLTIDADLPTVVLSGSTPTLPSTAKVSIAGGEAKDYKITWKLTSGSWNEAGTVEVTGTIADLNRTYTATIQVISDKILYYINSNADSSENYDEVAQLLNLKNELPDQEYSSGSWGIVNDNSNVGGYSSTTDDIYSNGWYAKSGKNCEYILPLSAGNYTATAYYHEWWGVTRPMSYYISYTDDDGNVVTSEANKVSLSGANNNITSTISFSIENVKESVEVHFITTKYSSSDPDPVISGLVVEGEASNAADVGDVEYDTVIKVNPESSTRFNDTNGDGFGEFQGWGTSLCWWANRLGYSAQMTAQAAKDFFSDEGLDLNIGRYNIGGGDDVTDKEAENIEANEKAKIYDLSDAGKNPTYSGKSMSVKSVDFSSTTYTVSDADFGFVSGAKAGKFNYIGWVNNINGTAGNGDNLTYTVEVDAEGDYTIKLLLTLTGSNKRGMAINVNSDETYYVDYASINDSMIATNGNNMLMIAKFENIKLNKGTNIIRVAGGKNSSGSDDWGLDFIKMLIVASGDEATVETGDKYLHSSHITRSDSVVPGYCVDITEMDLNEHTLAYYQENYARADETSGYAWNYDWNADNNQVNILVAAAEASGEDFIAEAFSNSPPYFMTESGCSSGNADASEDNLREDCVTAFACYLADVIEHLNNEDNGITFQSATAMNEPYTNYWSAYSNKQEGCHFDMGESQSRIIVALNEELKNKGIDIVISASDETSIDTAISSYEALSDDAKSIITRIDTHTYSGSKRSALADTAEKGGENLWMSEVDGAFVAGSSAGEMSAALGLANRIITDVKGLDCTAWILWNAVDMNVDADNEYDYDTLEALIAAGDYNSESGYWGIAIGDHNNENIILTKKYYGYGQFTRYIRPGMTIVSSTGSSLTAWDPDTKELVVVALNTSAKDKTLKLDLSGFDSIGSSVTATRTSGDLETGENWADVTNTAGIIVDKKNNYLYSDIIANSITTFVIENVNYSGDGSGSKTEESESKATDSSLVGMTEITITEDMISGSTPWNNSTTADVDKLIDNNLNTYFDGLEEGYVLVDLGKATKIGAISYAPRNGYTSRMTGGIFYGSNDGEKWQILYTIEDEPTALTLTTVLASKFETDATSYRYIKYTAADGSCANIAEIKLYTTDSVEKTSVTYSSITGVNGETLYDTNGNVVQAHGGQITKIGDTYYWVGEDKTYDYRPCPGVHMYSSKDLYNWTDEGLVLKTMADASDFNKDYFSSLYGTLAEDGSLTEYQQSVYNDLWQGDGSSGCVIERPKMLYNEATGKYILFFHADGSTPNSTGTSNYAKAKLGIAISDSVKGPYKLLGTYLLHTDTGYDSSWDSENGHVRDMNVFKDDDGTAYVIYSSDGNTNMYIAKLNDEYTGLAMSGTDENGNPIAVEGVDYSVNFVGASREAPAMFKRGDKYYMITSGCTGWAANAAKYAVADSVLGPWTLLDNPCTDSGASTTYDTQSTCVVDLGEGRYMYMGDRWSNPDKGYLLRDSSYVWLPIEFTTDGGIEIARYSDWTLDVYDSIRPFAVVTKLSTTANSLAEFVATLPTELEIQYEGALDTDSYDVSWNTDSLSEGLGEMTISGTLSNGRTVSTTVNVFNNKLIYYFDCAGTVDGVTVTDDFADLVFEKLSSQLKNSALDQAYTEENAAGYTGTIGTDIGSKNAGESVYEHGWWAYSGKTIDYSFDLPAGDYTVYAGFAEWWSTSRYMQISVFDSEEELASTSFTLASSDTANQQTISFTLAEAATVTVSVAKTSGADPVLSYIAVADNNLSTDTGEDEKEETGKTEGSSSSTTGSATSSSTSSSSSNSFSLSKASTNDEKEETLVENATNTLAATGSESRTNSLTKAQNTVNDSDITEDAADTEKVTDDTTIESSSAKEETSIENPETPAAADSADASVNGLWWILIVLAAAIVIIAVVHNQKKKTNE